MEHEVVEPKPPSGKLERLADVLLWVQLLIVILFGAYGAAAMAIAAIDPTFARMSDEERIGLFVVGTFGIPVGFALASALASAPYIIKGKFKVLPPQHRGLQIAAIVGFPIFTFAMTALFAMFAPDRI